MPNLIEITDFNSSLLDVYARLTGPQLRKQLEGENGIFIAESPTVIEVALKSGCQPLSLLTDKGLINGSVSGIINMLDKYKTDSGSSVPIYTANRKLLIKIVGFELTRGALCAMKRPNLPSVEAITANARRIAIFEDITDSTNIGALFRSAAALNIDAVLVSPSCCDPLCRRAVRVSMGTVFQVPFTRIGVHKEDWPSGINKLKTLGFKTVAMALTDNSVPIDDPQLMSEERLAIILGTEGTGLSKETIEMCDYTAKIPMSHEVDSLNVAAAGAVAFWQLAHKRT